MTKEQFQILDKHYDILYSVAKTLTLMAPNFQAIDEMYTVYEQLGYRPANMRCNECRVNMLLTLYRLYEENKNNFEEKPVEKNADKKVHNAKRNAKNDKTKKG